MARRFVGMGLMSGSSLDGLDLALAEFWLHSGESESWAFRLLATHTEPYPREWHDRLAALPAATAAELAKTHADFGHLQGLLARRFALEAGIGPQWVALHGHTVFHQPQRQFTLQVGCPEAAASHLAVPVVANFRARDVALGGQGAPLVPFGDWHLFPDHGLFLNLGGIANLSLLPRTPQARAALQGLTWLQTPPAYLALDVTACNQPLNALARLHSPGLGCDPQGQIARQGALNPGLLETLNAWPYLHLPAPKSLGNEDVRDAFGPLWANHPAPISDKLHTVCVHIAQQVAAVAGRSGQPPSAILATGGGTENTFLMTCLRTELAPLGFTLAVPCPELRHAKEALVFAFLGLHTLLGRPNILPGTTGARTAICAGSVHGGFPLAAFAG